MPNTNAAFELLDDNRWDDQPEEEPIMTDMQPTVMARYNVVQIRWRLNDLIEENRERWTRVHRVSFHANDLTVCHRIIPEHPYMVDQDDQIPPPRRAAHSAREESNGVPGTSEGARKAWITRHAREAREYARRQLHRRRLQTGYTDADRVALYTRAAELAEWTSEQKLLQAAMLLATTQLNPPVKKDVGQHHG